MDCEEESSFLQNPCFMMSDHKKVSDNDPSKKWHKKTGKVWMTMPVWEFLSNSI